MMNLYKRVYIGETLCDACHISLKCHLFIEDEGSWRQLCASCQKKFGLWKDKEDNIPQAPETD